MKVLLTGAAGQLGRVLVDAFDDHEVMALGHHDLDVGDEAAVYGALATARPDVVVNAAAWTDVDGCEADPVRSHAVNALGAWWVARACDRVGATLVHISTDYVFGDPAPVDAQGRVRPWTEFDPTVPLNVYGRSKLAAEHLVIQTLERHHVIRTAWLAGPTGANFVRAILRRARAGEPLQVVTDQVGSFTYVRDLAQAVREVAVGGRYGIWHRTNDGHASRYELACAAVEAAGYDVPVEPVGSSSMPRPARRPHWSVLDNTHAVTVGLGVLPDWRDGVARLVGELEDQ